VELQRGEQVIVQEQHLKHGAWLVFIQLCFMEKRGELPIKI
jgi:hypothetical protein